MNVRSCADMPFLMVVASEFLLRRACCEAAAGRALLRTGHAVQRRARGCRIVKAEKRGGLRPMLRPATLLLFW